MPSAATKNAAEAFVKHASTAATPATTPQRRPPLAPARTRPSATTMNAVIVDSMSAARFHITKT